MSTARSRVSEQFGSDATPIGQFSLIPNVGLGDPPENYLVLPGAGTLTVGYAIQPNDKEATVYIDHENADPTPVTLGYNNYEVGDGDSLVWMLAYEGQIIKLSFYYD